MWEVVAVSKWQANHSRKSEQNITSCITENSSMLYTTFTEEITLEMNPYTEGFLSTVLCRQPGRFSRFHAVQVQ
jgi:hypothetical protein